MSIESQIVETLKELQELNGSKRSASLKKKGILKFRQLDLILNLLEEEDPEFNVLWNQNLDLLDKGGLKFTVYAEDSGYLKVFTKELSGEIGTKGVLYLENSKTGNVLDSLGLKLYPKGYVGRIDGLGRMKVVVSSQGFQFLGSRVPKSFVGDISSNGEVKLILNDSRFEFSGTNVAEKLVCDPFRGNENERMTFLRNKHSILKKAARRLFEIEQKYHY